MSLTARASHGSQAVARHDREVREVVTDGVEPLDFLWPARHPRSHDPGIDEHRQVFFDAGRVDRVHLRVVDGDLGKLAAREHADAHDVVGRLRLLDAAHRTHHVVRIAHVVAEHEAVRVALPCLDPGRTAARLADCDAPAIHLRQRPLDRIGVGRDDVGDVLEHVLGRELHLPDRLGVLVQRAHELVGSLLLLDAPVGEADAEVVDADVVGEAHPSAPVLRFGFGAS